MHRSKATSTFADKGKRHLKVCHAVVTADGAPWLVDQLRELRDNHHWDVVALVPAPEGSLIESLRSANIRYEVVNTGFVVGPPGELRKMFAAIIKLARFFRRERFDVVQTHVFLSLLTARPAAWIADVPVRASMLASPYPLQAPATRAIERLTCWMETAVIPTSQKTLDLCRQLNIPDRHLGPIVYYGVDEKKFDPKAGPPANVREEFGWSADTPVICMVAYFYPPVPPNRWTPSVLHNRALKGHEDLIGAALVILREFPNARFLLVGSAWPSGGEPYLAEIRRQVEELKLEKSVIFAGYRPDVNRILLEANVVVHASLVENLGGTIEALMMGRPVVATRGTGMVDTVRDGETGVLVDPGNPVDLARGILELLRDPERAEALGAAGRKLMLERFTLARTGSALAELYHRSLAKSRPRKFHDSLVSCMRAVASLPILLFIAIRYVIIDLYVPLFLRYDIANLRTRLYHFVRYLPYRLMGKLGRLRHPYRNRT